jgi:hypothetical protein
LSFFPCRATGLVPDVQAALRGETPVSAQTSQPVQGVRMVTIDDTPDENDD